MTSSQKIELTAPLIQDLLDAFDALNGLHAGFRPAHAKGVMVSGTFTPASTATQLTRAPHVARPSTRVIVRFSDFAGIPTIADNDPQGAGPRGMATRFYLGEHEHTDIIAHSTDGFPARTGEEFLGFLRAAKASGPDAPHPTPIEQFLTAHPAALAFVMTPKPIPTSFACESFFGRSPLRFVNANGAGQFGRFRLRPAAGNNYLAADAAATKSADFLVDELADRLSRGPVEFRITVQLAGAGDPVDDATAQWPGDRPEVDFGTLSLTRLEDHNDVELRKIIFDPIPRVDGIEASNDPLLEVRAALYLLSGRRRRAAPT